MPRYDIIKTHPVMRTGRVMQLEGMFDLPLSTESTTTWTLDIELPETWNIGVIVGPSGSGKSTIARELFGDFVVDHWLWDTDKSIVDCFPHTMSIKDITALLSSVGFSSPPAWVRPFHALSNGEQFRVYIARTLAEQPDLAVVDEFSSVVDRTVAQIGSAAIAKTVRNKRQKFVAVTCHYDVVEWLDPDWVFEPATNTLHTGRWLQRPPIELHVRRVTGETWQLFRHHHYLNTSLHASSRCFVAYYNGRPVAFAAILHFPYPNAKNIKREHRCVCLPDFQGIGIGNAMSATMGAMCRALGYRYQSQTSHPAMIQARARSRQWQMKQKPNNTSGTMDYKMRGGSSRGIATRLRATFEYVGEPMDVLTAQRLWKG